MIRGFVTGLVWGGVVAGAGLVVISQVAPLPTPADAVAEADTAPIEATAPAPAETETDIEAGNASLVKPDEVATESGAGAGGRPATVAVNPPNPVSALELTDPAVVPPAPKPSDTPSVPPLVPVAPLGAEPAPAAPEPPPTEALVRQEPLLDKTPLPAVPVVPDAEADDLALPGDLPRQIVPDTSALPKVTALLPDPSALPTTDDPLAETGEPASVPEIATPLELFARPFDNPDDKPLFSILLVDDGLSSQDREIFAALPFAVTFVLDPLAPAAAEAAAAYRTAGQEVMFQTTAILDGASASDVEQAMQALDIAVPEAVAALGSAGIASGGQTMAMAVVPILAEQGRGVVTLDRGLNPVDQVAQREGVPHATVFRILDEKGESVPVIRRYLDRAAFRAAQEGSVVVLGSARPDTIAAILQWTVEGRAASVAIAPISAVLRANTAD